jgi:hypothetical protein
LQGERCCASGALNLIWIKIPAAAGSQARQCENQVDARD